MTATIGSLFTGAGGLDMAVQSVFDARVIWHSEIEPAACRVLDHRYPDVPNLGDVTTVDWSTVQRPDILTGGFPCQDVSAAGKRAGMLAGNRSGLWARTADAIDALRPPLVVIENVRGLLSAKADSALEFCAGCMGGDDAGGPVLRALGRVLGDLADLRYDVRWHGLRAADVGAPHGRYRIFIVARDADAGDLHGRSTAGQQGQAGSSTGPAGRREAVFDAGIQAVGQRPGLRPDEPTGQRRGRPDDDRVQEPAADARGPRREGHGPADPAGGRDAPRRAVADAPRERRAERQSEPERRQGRPDAHAGR